MLVYFPGSLFKGTLLFSGLPDKRESINPKGWPLNFYGSTVSLIVLAAALGALDHWSDLRTAECRVHHLRPRPLQYRTWLSEDNRWLLPCPSMKIGKKYE